MKLGGLNMAGPANGLSAINVQARNLPRSNSAHPVEAELSGQNIKVLNFCAGRTCSEHRSCFFGAGAGRVLSFWITAEPVEIHSSTLTVEGLLGS